MHEIYGITTMGGARRRDVRFAKLPQSTHRVLQPNEFGNDRSSVDVHIEKGTASLFQPE
jgi:hypothetical protein